MLSGDGVTRRTVLESLGVAGVATTGAGSVVARQHKSAGPDDTPSGRRGAITELKILHDTHVHGRMGGLGKSNDLTTVTIEEYFGLMDRLAEEADHAMRLGVGDDLGSSALSTKFGGRHIVDAFEAGGLSHDTFGNHDFDFGPDTLRHRVAESTFQWVTANVVQNGYPEVFGEEQGVKRFDVVDLGPINVGITGITTPRASEVTSLGDNKVVDPVTALKDVVPVMNGAGADVIVVLSHVANTAAMDIAKQVDGIDLFVGDDAAEVLGAKTVNDTILGFVGDGYDHLGELAVSIDDDTDTITDYEYRVHDVDRSISYMDVEPDQAVEIVASSYRSRVDVTVIGRSTVQLNCRGEALRTRETNMGNFVADTVRSSVGSDVAIQNGGGIRTDTLYPAGEITDLMINQILPFGNTIVELEVSGRTLRSALENGVSEVDSLEGRFPQVSGMSFEWNPEASPGNRIVSVTIDGSQIDPDATYTLGTNSFMAGGGDGYDMLPEATRVEETEQTLSDAVIARIKQLTPISPEVEGRITRV